LSRLDRSATHQTLRKLGGKQDERDISAGLLAFSRVLRRALPGITSGRVIDAARSLNHVNVHNYGEFRAAVKTNFISNHDDEPVFDSLFQMYFDPQDDWWDSPQDPSREEALGSDQELDLPEAVRQQLASILQEGGEEVVDSDSAEEEGPSYSGAEVLTQKDFADFNGTEIKMMRQIIRRVAPKLATVLSRRTKVSPNGKSVDLRRTFRTNLRYGGEIFKLARRRRKIKKMKVILLCDVSGSMDVYSKFLIQFVYGLENELAGVSSWVFSTRLTDVTPIMRNRDFDEAMTEVSKVVQDWSGGTSIGRCLYDFATGPQKRKVSSRTIVIIISDGWDRGDVKVLDEAMRMIKRRAHAIIWMNPLAGSPKYEPICAGMRAAWPYIDVFLPAHNIESFIKLGRTLDELARSI